MGWQLVMMWISLCVSDEAAMCIVCNVALIDVFMAKAADMQVLNEEGCTAGG